MRWRTRCCAPCLSGPGVHLFKLPVDSHNVHTVQTEHLFDFSGQLCADRFDVRHVFEGKLLLPIELCNRRKGNAGLRGNDGDSAVLVRPVAMSVHDNHFPVYVFKGAQSGVPLLNQLPGGDDRTAVSQSKGLKG